MHAKKGTRVSFTINNPQPEDIPDPGPWKYLIYGKEVGESGTPHLQCFGILRDQTAFSTVAAMLPRAHIEWTKKTNMANIKYCQKNKDYVEHGESPIRGQAGGLATKRKWDEIKSNAKAGDFDKIEDEVFVKHYHNLKRIRQDYITAPPDLESPCGLWIWGEPRVGKSYKVRKDYPDYYDKPCNKWWDGYQGEPYILIDDFDRNHVCLGHHIKRWSDRYAFPAEQKGTTIQIRPKKIIVTSNYSPEQIWEDTTLCKAIESRFEIIYLEKQY